jgi:hypothetical protein
MSDDKTPVFTAETLGDALAELGQLAHESGRVIDIAVYGGSCLMLVRAFSTPPRKSSRRGGAGPATG